MIDPVKKYINQYFEHIFVLVILLVTSGINYFVPHKIAFLNFYFLPIILGAYYLGQKRAMLGAVFCSVMIFGYMLLDPQAFITEQTTLELFLHLLIWSCFLLLSASVVGRLQDNLRLQIANAHSLNQQLAQSQQELKESNLQLRDTNQNLEQRVEERTLELQQSKAAVEKLKGKVESALYSTMDSAVVNLMIEGRLRNEKRQMSVMFVDLVGFTTYSERMQPENVVADLNRYLQDMEPLMLAYHGHIDKYMGDGIMCEFGAPIEYAMHTLMAVVCAVKMQKVLKDNAHPWQMRVGIASGAAIAGLIGGSRRQSYTAIGDIVNLAARLERYCTPGAIVIDRATCDEIGRFFELKKCRDFSLQEHFDVKKEQELDRLNQALLLQPDDADLHFQMGQIHLQIQEPLEAQTRFETALRLAPSNDQYKIAYAEAGLKLKAQDKISVKGKQQRVEVFEVLAMKDPLLNRDKFPQHFYDKYHEVSSYINIPEEVVLPSEVVDGSVGQSRVVAVLSYAIADYLCLTESEKRDIMHAAFLADIGKELISPALRNRRGGLSTGEFEAIRRHPDESCRQMRKMGYDNPAVLTMVRYSHEHFNGQGGYPNECQADTIPLGSRIIAVVDAYDALTSWRPYREAWERSAALGEIRREMEKGVFDPMVFAALVDLLD